MSRDEIRLTMPRQRPYYGVAHLVLGGVASRLDLTVEHLEELELALDGLLDRRDGGEEVTLTLRVLDGGLAAELGPFSRQLLDAVVDGLVLEERDGGTWIELRKQTGTDGLG